MCQSLMACFCEPQVTKSSCLIKRYDLLLHSAEPRTEELDAIKEMKTKCEGVVQFTDDLLSGANVASSTTATGKRRKRSNVPYFCDDLVFELDKIKSYLEEGNRTGQVS